MKTALKHLTLGLCGLAFASCSDLDQNKKNADQALDNAPSGSRFLQDNSGQPGTGSPTTPNPQPSANPETPPNPDVPPSQPKPPDAANNNPAPANPTPPPATGAPQYPYGKPVPGKKGFVYSPYDEKAGMIDVKDYAPGTKVRDPYTNKIFLVP